MKHKEILRDFQAEHIASEFPTFADWKRFRDFYGGDKKIDFNRYHRAKQKSATWTD